MTNITNFDNLFLRPVQARRIRLNCTKTLGGWCPALKHEWIG